MSHVQETDRLLGVRGESEMERKYELTNETKKCSVECSTESGHLNRLVV